MKTGDLLEMTHNIADRLEHEASLRLNEKIQIAQAEKRGYDQACEDFARAMRLEIQDKAVNKDE